MGKVLDGGSADRGLASQAQAGTGRLIHPTRRRRCWPGCLIQVVRAPPSLTKPVMAWRDNSRPAATKLGGVGASRTQDGADL